MCRLMSLVPRLIGGSIGGSREVTTGESWLSMPRDTRCPLCLDQHHEFAYFDPSGVFLYTLRYYDGKELPKDMAEDCKKEISGF